MFRVAGGTALAGGPPVHPSVADLTALGSDLGCVVVKRASGKGCITRLAVAIVSGSGCIRVQFDPAFSAAGASAFFSEYRVTWSPKAATAS